jgi:UV DNA damage endonuclease
MQLGFPVSALGRPRLKSHDGRRWQNRPHLSISLLYLRDILEYLHDQDIHLYRMSPFLAPYVTHPDLPQFRDQIEECAETLEHMGQLASAYHIRLSFHATPYTTLSAPDSTLVRKSMVDLQAWTQILDRMHLGPDAVIVLHLGGRYDDRMASMARFVAAYQELAPAVRRRLALENDDAIYSLADVLDVARRVEAPVVFDALHLLNHNPEGMELDEALEAVWKTWPAGRRPKLHFSSPRTEMKPARGAGVEGGLRPPNWTEHADFVNPFEFITFARHMPAIEEVDIMLEAKAKDLALLRLRADLARFAPELIERDTRSKTGNR